MFKLINYLNAKWNQAIYRFHDVSTRTGIRWLVSLSIWAYDRLHWRLSDEWQLICGVPFKEYKLRYELELAHHQTRYFADYAYELQCRILFSDKNDGDEDAQKREKADSAPVTNASARVDGVSITKSKKRKRANK